MRRSFPYGWKLPKLNRKLNRGFGRRGRQISRPVSAPLRRGRQSSRQSFPGGWKRPPPNLNRKPCRFLITESFSHAYLSRFLYGQAIRMYAEGYRTERALAHYRTLQALPLILGSERSGAATLDLRSYLNEGGSPSPVQRIPGFVGLRLCPLRSLRSSGLSMPPPTIPCRQPIEHPGMRRVTCVLPTVLGMPPTSFVTAAA